MLIVKKSLLPAFFFCLFCLLVLPLLVSAELSPEAAAAQKAKLEADLEQVNKEIAIQKTLLSSKQKETASVARDIAILDVKIKTAKLNIKMKQIEIERLGASIGKKAVAIGDYTTRIGKEGQSLSELLKKTRELDNRSLAEFVLSDERLSRFFVDLDYFNSLQVSIQESLDMIRGVRTTTEKEKKGLEVKRDEVAEAKAAIELEKKEIERDEAEKQRLLAIGKAEERQYQKVLSEKQAKKQAILSALFSLKGGNKKINFGQALEYAKVAAKGTGVRPAFLLAILTQETNLGQNVGTCNRAGDPPSKSWKNIMKPDRDIAPFKKITSELGIDPDTVPLSCPMGGGWGGAMGPAQFIPSTWAAFKSRIAKVTGHNPPNPWEPVDAFAASSVYLSDLGASAQTREAERRAALKYYAGGNWQKPQNAFYGNQVMALADKYTEQIKYLQDN